MRNRMIFLVALAFVALAFLSTTNTAWAKSTPIARTSAEGASTSLDPRPTFNRQDILALQGRASALETNLSSLETRVNGIKVPSTRQLKADVADLQTRLQAAETALTGKVSQADFDRALERIEAVESALPTIRQRLTRLEERVDQLEVDMRAEQAEPKAGLLIGVDCLGLGHDSVSDLGIRRFGAGVGVNLGVIVETQTHGLIIDGGVNWVTSGLRGTNWHISAMNEWRRVNAPAFALGLSGSMTTLGEAGDVYYNSWGLGPEGRVMWRSNRIGENKFFLAPALAIGVTLGPVYQEGEQIASFRPAGFARVSIPIQGGARGPRRR